jgi:intraflagellar transport protein 80
MPLRYYRHQGKSLGDPWSHTLEVKEISLSQAGHINDRQLIIIDRNRDLYLLPVLKRNIAKLAAMCDSARWHDTTAMLAAMVDQRLVSRVGRCWNQSHGGWPRA